MTKLKLSQASIQFEKFIQLWQGNTTDLVETFLTQDIQLSSSHRGNQRSISQVIDHLKMTLILMQVTTYTSQML